MTAPVPPKADGSALAQRAQDAECAEMAEDFPGVTFSWDSRFGFRARFADGPGETADTSTALRRLVRLRLHGRLG